MSDEEQQEQPAQIERTESFIVNVHQEGDKITLTFDPVEPADELTRWAWEGLLIVVHDLLTGGGEVNAEYIEETEEPNE